MEHPTMILKLHKMLTLVLIFSLFLTVFTNSTSAQTVKLTLTGKQVNDGFGFRIINAGDWDGDEFPDIAAGSPFYKLPNYSSAGRFAVLSGKTGAELFGFTGSPQFPVAGIWVSDIGDLTNDGIPELAVGSSVPSAGVKIFAGGIGMELLSVTGAVGAIALADVNQVGLTDLVLAGGGTMSLRKYSYQTTQWSKINFGSIVSMNSDVDNDGFDDFLEAKGNGGEFSAGFAAVFSGKTGALIWSFPDEYIGIYPKKLGGGFGVIGDINGDGKRDFALASLEIGYETHLRSGATGDKLAVLQGYQTVIINSFGDIDGDGVEDFVNGPVPTVFSGRTLKVIYSMPQQIGFGFWHSAAMGDIDNDDFPDFCIGGQKSGNNQGKIFLYSGAPIGVATFGTGVSSPNTQIPRIGATGSARIGHPFPINLSLVNPGSRAWLVIGDSSTYTNDPNLPADLTTFGFPQCELVVNPEIVIPTLTYAVGPGLSSATIELPIPNDAALVGTEHFAQWLVSTPGFELPGACTRGLRFVVQQ
ncbi:MAG: hypothetical protein ACKVS6_07060 [Planctomycetota bacterium]